MRRTHVFLALGHAAMGETTMGIRVARDLERAGDRAVFITTEWAAPLFRGGDIEQRTIPVDAGAVNELRIDDCIRDERPASIVLADFHVNDQALKAMRIEPRFLTRYGVPIVAIDTWCSSETDNAFDSFRGQLGPASPWIADLPRLIPAPLARPAPAPGVCALLPEPVRLTAPERALARAEFGLGPDDRAVLLTTAPFQHRDYADEDGRRLAEAVPRIVGSYLAALGPAVRLVHIGPSPLLGLSEALGPERYRFFSPRYRKFGRAVGAADVLLSLNAAATTIAAAIVSSIPVVVIANSSDGPLVPYWTWPLGYRVVLDKIFRANAYLDAIEVVELLDAESAVRTLRTLLEDDRARAGLAARQAAYVAQVERLPRPAEVVDQLLGGAPGGPS